MPVFELFFKILKKKYKTIFWYLVIFFAMSLIMFKSEPVEDSFKESVLDVAVFDEDNTPASKAVTEMIGKKHNIKDISSEQTEIAELLYWGEVDYVLVIKQGFAQNLTDGKTEGLFEEKKVHDSYSSHYMSSWLSEFVKTAEAYIAKGSSTDEAASRASELMLADTEVEYLSIKGEGPPEYTRQFSQYFQFMPYIMISGMCYSLTVILMVINRKDVRFRTDCSAVSSKSSTMQIFGASGVFVGVLWCIMMIMGIIIYGGIFEGRAWVAVLNSLVFSFVAAAFAVLVSSFDLSDNALNIIAQLVGMGMAFISGVFVPQSLLGNGVLSAARFTPAYWYIEVNDALVERDGIAYDFTKCLGYMGIEICFGIALVLMTLVIRRSKKSDTTA